MAFDRRKMLFPSQIETKKNTPQYKLGSKGLSALFGIISVLGQSNLQSSVKSKLPTSLDDFI